MPDAIIFVENKIENRIREEFGRYMSLSKTNPIAFGIDSSRLYSKIKSIIEDCPTEFQNLDGRMVCVSFDEDCGKSENEVMVSRSSKKHDFEFLVNRSYNELGRVLGLGLVSLIKADKSNFSVYLTSSELCRGTDSQEHSSLGGESVNDLQLTVINKDDDYCLSIKDHYALDKRSNNSWIMNQVMCDVSNYISSLKGGFVDIKALHEIVGKDEEERGIIFKEGLKNLQQGQLGFEVKDHGFKVWYPGKHLNSHWNEIYFHTNYEDADISDIEGFRDLFSETAYKVLKMDSDIRTKLEIVSRLVDNKKKFDKIYPLDLY